MPGLPGIEHQLIQTNGIRLHLVSAGPRDGKPVLLLHGFPDFWYGWRKQILFLAAAGLRVLVPDQRGYNLSDKPKGLAAYQLDTLVDDAIGLIDQLGYEKVVLAGHDWGAGVAWRLAARFPRRLDKLVILNVPLAEVLVEALRHQFSQVRKSWYIFFFQIPRLPEWLCRRSNFNMMACALTGSSRPGAFLNSDLAEYRQAWSQPGTLTAMINWYRANTRLALAPKGDPISPANRIQVPTTIIWGAQDHFLNRNLAQASANRCENASLVYFEEASHWVQLDEAEKVNSILLDFIRSSS